MCLQGQQRHPRVHLKQVFFAQLGQALQGIFYVLVPVAIDNSSLGADDRGGAQASTCPWLTASTQVGELDIDIDVGGDAYARRNDKANRISPSWRG